MDRHMFVSLLSAVLEVDTISLEGKTVNNCEGQLDPAL